MEASIASITGSIASTSSAAEPAPIASTECPQLCTLVSPAPPARRGVLEQNHEGGLAEAAVTLASPRVEYFALEEDCVSGEVPGAAAGSGGAPEAATTSSSASAATITFATAPVPPPPAELAAAVHVDGRVCDLERLAAEQQRVVADLSEVVLALQAQMQGMQDKLEQQSTIIAQLKEERVREVASSWQEKVIAAMDSDVARRPALPESIQEDMQRVEDVQRRFAALGLLGEAREEKAKEENEERMNAENIVRMASFNRMKTRLGELEATVCITSDIVAKNTTQAAQIQKQLESKEASAGEQAAAAKPVASAGEDAPPAAPATELPPMAPRPTMSLRSKSMCDRSFEHLRRATIPRSKSVCLHSTASQPTCPTLRLLSATPSRQVSVMASPPPTTRGGSGSATLPSSARAAAATLGGSAVFTPVQGMRSPLQPVRAAGPALAGEEKASAPQLVAVPSVRPPTGSPVLLGRGSGTVTAVTPRFQLPPGAELVKAPVAGGGAGSVAVAAPCVLAGIQSSDRGVPMTARPLGEPVAYAAAPGVGTPGGAAWPTGARGGSMSVPGGPSQGQVQVCVGAPAGKLNHRDQLAFVRVTPTFSSHPRLEGHVAAPPLHRS